MHVPSALSHCYSRTLRIETRKGVSTSFVMNHKDQEWIVTAKHVVDGSTKDDIRVQDPNGEWHSGLRRLPEMASSNADVAVFRPWADMAEFGSSLGPYVADDLHTTQAAYFLGFPDLGRGLDHVDPVTPLIKAAIISGQARDNDGTVLWLLDGLSSGGFSGGPLITRRDETEEFRVFGVVCCYVPTDLDVLPASVNRSIVRANMGLTIGFDIRHAVEAIERSG